MEQIGSHYKDVHEISCFSHFSKKKKSGQKFQGSLKSNKMTGTLHADRRVYICDNISLSFRMRNFSDQIYRRNRKTRLIFWRRNHFVLILAHPVYKM